MCRPTARAHGWRYQLYFLKKQLTSRTAWTGRMVSIPKPPVFTIEESERQQLIVWGSDNLFKSFLLEKGDVESAWAGAAHIVTGEYRTGAQEHLYIENNGVIAAYSVDTGVTVWGSLQ